jgi:hypothetical protein
MRMKLKNERWIEDRNIKIEILKLKIENWKEEMRGWKSILRIEKWKKESRGGIEMRKWEEEYQDLKLRRRILRIKLKIAKKIWE